MGLIRPATTKDGSSLAALAIEVWFSTYIKRGITPHFADYALAHFTADGFAKNVRDPNQLIYVSQNSEGIDGYVHLHMNSPDPASGAYFTEMVSLYVQPRHQGSGVGKALIKAVSSHRPYWFAVNTENTQALQFYTAQGFSKIGETSFKIGKEAYPNDIFLAS